MEKFGQRVYEDFYSFNQGYYDWRNSIFDILGYRVKRILKGIQPGALGKVLVHMVDENNPDPSLAYQS
jgi:hypothetical protein